MGTAIKLVRPQALPRAAHFCSQLITGHKNGFQNHCLQLNTATGSILPLAWLQYPPLPVSGCWLSFFATPFLVFSLLLCAFSFHVFPAIQGQHVSLGTICGPVLPFCPSIHNCKIRDVAGDILTRPFTTCLRTCCL